MEKKNTFDKLEYLIEVCVIRLQLMLCLKPLISALHNAVGVTFALCVCARLAVGALNNKNNIIMIVAIITTSETTRLI
jgi:hypothetical protein